MSNALEYRPMEILLIEDNLVDARFTMGALENSRIKYRLTMMRDGIEALEFLYRQGRFARAPRPDLILLDLELPRKNGREVLNQIKGEFDLQAIPVVILSASNSPEDMAQAEVLQVESYITKPVNFDKFCTVLRELKSFWTSDLALPCLSNPPLTPDSQYAHFRHD
jgi:chemotaxis family two-component system response regulator Rcp1